MVDRGSHQVWLEPLAQLRALQQARLTGHLNKRYPNETRVKAYEILTAVDARMEPKAEG